MANHMETQQEITIIIMSSQSQITKKVSQFQQTHIPSLHWQQNPEHSHEHFPTVCVSATAGYSSSSSNQMGYATGHQNTCPIGYATFQAPSTSLMGKKCEQEQQYSEWTLNKIHEELCQKDGVNYKITYIGVEDAAVVEGFIYGILNILLGKSSNNGSASSVNGSSGIIIGNAEFVKFKFGLYQIGRVALGDKDQRGLVEGLCNAAYARVVAEFIRGNQDLVQIMKKLVDSCSQKYQQKKSFFHPKQLSSFQKLKQFSKAFDFLKYTQISKNIAQIKIFSVKFYIIKQKKITFIFQKQQQNSDRAVPKSKLKENIDNSNKELQDRNNDSSNCKEKVSKKICERPAVPKFLQNNQKKQKKQIRYTQSDMKVVENQNSQIVFNKKNQEIYKVDPSQRNGVHYKLPQFLDARSSLQSNPTFEGKNIQTFKEERKTEEVHQKSIFSKNELSRLKSSKLEPRKSKKSSSKSPHQISMQERSFEKFSKRRYSKKIQINYKSNQGQNNSSKQNIARNSNSATKYKSLSPKSHSFLFTEKKKVAPLNAE